MLGEPLVRGKRAVDARAARCRGDSERQVLVEDEPRVVHRHCWVRTAAHRHRALHAEKIRESIPQERLHGSGSQRRALRPTSWRVLAVAPQSGVSLRGVQGVRRPSQ